jgi:hypothetical protein
MKEVGRIACRSPERAREGAGIAAALDPPQVGSMLALVAAGDEHFGRARKYRPYRPANPRSTREVRTFRFREGGDGLAASGGGAL